MGLFTWRWAVTSAVRRGGQWTWSGPSVAHSCSCGPSRTRLAGEGAYMDGRPQPGDVPPGDEALVRLLGSCGTAISLGLS